MNTNRKTLALLIAAEVVACYTVYCLAWGTEPFSFLPNFVIFVG